MFVFFYFDCSFLIRALSLLKPILKVEFKNKLQIKFKKEKEKMKLVPKVKLTLWKNLEIFEKVWSDPIKDVPPLSYAINK